jgi:hypothetical protein
MLLAEKRAARRSPPVQVKPIEAPDVERVAEFLHAHLNARVTKDAWVNAMRQSWCAESPNRGYMLLDGEAVVGAHLAFYSERELDDKTAEPICNLGAWCVLPEHRFHSLRLLRALLGQEGYTFTDLSPSGNVIPLNSRLGFDTLDTNTRLVPNLPWPGRARGAMISADPEIIERTLTGRDLRLYHDHADADAARHLVLIRDGRWGYVIFRKDRRKGLPLFASILYVSDRELLREMARPLARHLLIHHGALVTLAESRITGHLPLPSFPLRSPRTKMFRSARLPAAQVDYLYSELVCVPW